MPIGGILTLDTAWQLALAWYHDRLDSAWQRKPLKEAQALFTGLGMTDSFWELK